jgi:segregation and condensation protein B
MTIKHAVEAVLYSTGRKTTVEEIANLVKSPPEEVKQALKELQEDYDKRDSALMITGAEGLWKIDVKEKYGELCRNIISETDINKSTMETLAMIAYNQPAIQCDIIKKRTNKAYDHLSEIESLGFIVREKYGRTKKINLTQKFYDYFDVNREEIENLFNKFKKLNEKGDESEHELQQLEEEKKNVEEEIQHKEKLKKENAINIEQALDTIDGSAGYEEPNAKQLDWVEEERKAIKEKERIKAELEAKKKERMALRMQKAAQQSQIHAGQTVQTESNTNNLHQIQQDTEKQNNING